MAGTIVAGTLSDGTYTGSVTDTVRGACKAWVNFNGTGTVAIRASYNVSSITDNGTGDYTCNLINQLSDVNYCVTGSCYRGAVGSADGIFTNSLNISSTSYVRVVMSQTNGGSFDSSYVSVAIFR